MLTSVLAGAALLGLPGGFAITQPAIGQPVGDPPAKTPPAEAPLAGTLAGDWRGDLAPAPGQNIALVLHVTGTPGQWSATLDSPSQQALGLPVRAVTREGAAWRFALAMPNASFVATLSPDGQSLAGRWEQGGASLPLVMTHAGTTSAPATALARPQTPQPPFPYLSREVAYDNPAGPAHLTGTLTLPPGKGPFPAVLLITGSGQQDRDETLFGHKPFLLWADTLTRRGLAVLRVDDRQTGGSTGDVAGATTRDFAGDVAAGVAFLRHQADIDPARIGLMGHSEGGVIAPMVAAQDPGIHFIVLLAGVGVPGDVLLAEQVQAMATARGLPAAAVEHQVALERQLVALVRGTPDPAAALAAIRRAWPDIAREGGLPPGEVPNDVLMMAKPWVHWFVNHDPAPVLAQVHCPVLAIDGSLDRQVVAATNLAAIKAALAGNRDATVIQLPGLNHLFQTATTGLPSEYGTITQTIAPLALTTVSDWIVAHGAR
jgi:uncharacterized protein